MDPSDVGAMDPADVGALDPSDVGADAEVDAEPGPALPDGLPAEASLARFRGSAVCGALDGRSSDPSAS